MGNICTKNMVVVQVKYSNQTWTAGDKHQMEPVKKMLFN